MVINKVSVLRLLCLQQPVIDTNAQQCHHRHHFSRSRYFNMIVTSNSRLHRHRHHLHAALHLVLRSSLAASILLNRSSLAASFLHHRSGRTAHLRRLRVHHLKDTQLPRPRHIAMYQRRTAPHDDQHHQEHNHNHDLSNTSNHSNSNGLSFKFSAAKIAKISHPTKFFALKILNPPIFPLITLCKRQPALPFLSPSRPFLAAPLSPSLSPSRPSLAAPLSPSAAVYGCLFPPSLFVPVALPPFAPSSHCNRLFVIS